MIFYYLHKLILMDRWKQCVIGRSFILCMLHFLSSRFLLRWPLVNETLPSIPHLKMQLLSQDSWFSLLGWTLFSAVRSMFQHSVQFPLLLVYCLLCLFLTVDYRLNAGRDFCQLIHYVSSESRTEPKHSIYSVNVFY